MSNPRIGIVGPRANTGLGEVNRQLCKYLGIHDWLTIPSNREPTLLPQPGVKDWLGWNNKHSLRRFLEAVDVVLFAETTYTMTIPLMAKDMGKRVVCVPMLEWLPPAGKEWTREVDLFISPTVQCYLAIKGELPSVCFPWPVDTLRFPFQQRLRCERFLFLNGHGGWGGRKGQAVIAEALKLWPEIPLTWVSQQRCRPHDVGLTFPNLKVMNSVPSNDQLYLSGDVLLCPHSTDGIGLEPMEAMASGMPVITTDGEPWNEMPALDSIGSTIKPMLVQSGSMGGRTVDWHYVDPVDLVRACKDCLGRVIVNASVKANQWAQGRSWSKMAEPFLQLVREGKAS